MKKIKIIVEGGVVQDVLIPFKEPQMAYEVIDYDEPHNSLNGSPRLYLTKNETQKKIKGF